MTSTQSLNQVYIQNFVFHSEIFSQLLHALHTVFLLDFAMGKGLASTIACCYPELQELSKLPINNFPLGSLVTHFDQQHQRFIYNLVTKRRYFHKSTYETLELSL